MSNRSGAGAGVNYTGRQFELCATGGLSVTDRINAGLFDGPRGASLLPHGRVRTAVSDRRRHKLRTDPPRDEPDERNAEWIEQSGTGRQERHLFNQNLQTVS